MANFKIHRKNFKNTNKKLKKRLSMKISLCLALVIRSKLIIYLINLVAEICTQKGFPFFPFVVKRTSHLSVTWQKSSIDLLSVYLKIFDSRPVTFFLFLFQTMTSLSIYTRSQSVKVKSSLIA